MRFSGLLLLRLGGLLRIRISIIRIRVPMLVQVQVLMEMPVEVQECQKKDHTMRSSRWNSCTHSMCTAMHSSFYLHVPMGYNSFFSRLCWGRGLSVSCLVICFIALGSLGTFILRIWDIEVSTVLVIGTVQCVLISYDYNQNHTCNIY